ncbi:MAG: hypothetical protein HXY34_04185 [Candidatus Thorarchaeota archaeon]|nr:hypothetical protein [Candidatus Thorarchaeota archaeon]
MPSSNNGEPLREFQGLDDNETVQWSQNARLSYRTCVLQGVLPLLLGTIILLSLASASHTAGVVAQVIMNVVGIIGGFGLLIMLIRVLYKSFQVQRTMYYITDRRLVEVLGTFIVREIPRTSLEGLEAWQFMRESLSHRSPGKEYINVRVCDPVSSTVIVMSAVGTDVPEVITKWSRKRRNTGQSR